ncbi:MAG: lipoyl(octanoyl) transferase LipB [Methylophilales bacterium]|nr:lipoyl(octanoyl) transferase LipB [Methylophilales bacterium]
MTLLVKELGETDYLSTWQAMQAFTARRNTTTPDEIWLTEHPSVYTLGLNKNDLHPPSRNDIPLVESDRGGKITYHGPGQTIVYLLLDLKRRDLKVRQLVSLLESAVINLLAEYDIKAEARRDAPGVYVDGRKIASLGLRLKNGYCYHGLSLNVDMELSPFSAIDPCGYKGLEVTRLRDLGVLETSSVLSQKLLHHLQLGLM